MKETRIRVLAEAFGAIGFYFEYKQKVFEGMVRLNLKRGYARAKPCNPKAKKVREKKPRHPDEASARLPGELCGKHFDAYYKVCKALGCKQGHKSPQKEFFDVGEEG